MIEISYGYSGELASRALLMSTPMLRIFRYVLTPTR
jgi:hypothetical protein